MPNNANDLYTLMVESLRYSTLFRTVDDVASPTKVPTREAFAGCSFRLSNITSNFVTCRPCDRAWAVANVLHFFTGSEEASVLRRYNKHAERFLDAEGRWLGAYGAIALPQLNKCVELLDTWPLTRRAIITMGGLEYQDINRPACWSFLHFLQQRGKLDLLVYQRSLSLSVMPYDCVLLTSILHYAATILSVPSGQLHWMLGSLHSTDEIIEKELSSSMAGSVIIPIEILSNPAVCKKELENGLQSISS